MRLWPLVGNRSAAYWRGALVPVPIEDLFALLLPPDNMQVIGVHYDPIDRTVFFEVEHPDLQPVEPGDLLQQLQPTYTRTDKNGCITMTAEWDLFGGML